MKIAPPRRILLLVAVLAVPLGCTAGLRGVPFKGPKATGKVVASTWTAQPGGLLVLWNGQTSGSEMQRQAWIAGSAEAFAAVWSVAAVGEAPAVDFARYVVIAEAGEGGVCRPKIIGLEAEASGLLTLRFEDGSELTPCILLATRVARIVAVPRRVLPASVVFLNGFAFEVPDVPFG
jgi:hypothetical protein